MSPKQQSMQTLKAMLLFIEIHSAVLDLKKVYTCFTACLIDMKNATHNLKLWEGLHVIGDK